MWWYVSRMGWNSNEKEEEMADTKRVSWAVEQLKQKHEKPFFLAVGLYAPHYPNYCPQKYFDLYTPMNSTAAN